MVKVPTINKNTTAIVNGINGTYSDMLLRSNSIDLNEYKRTGKEISSTLQRIIMKLEGFAGTGKTTFYLGDVARAKEIGIPPEKCLIYVIDFIGGSGISNIISDSTFFPPEYINSVIHVQSPSLIVGDSAIKDFYNVCTSKDFQYISLAIEGDHMIFEKARDEYTLSTRGKFYEQVVNDALIREVEDKQKAKIVFEESIRDAYSYINPRYSRFVDTCFVICEKLRANIFLTAHLEYKSISFDSVQYLRVLGKPQRIDGYFDHILRLFCKEEFITAKTNNIEKITRFLIDMKKCRRAKTTILPNRGIVDYMKQIELLRQSEPLNVLISKNIVKDGDRLEEIIQR